MRIDRKIKSSKEEKESQKWVQEIFSQIPEVFTIVVVRDESVFVHNIVLEENYRFPNVLNR